MENVYFAIPEIYGDSLSYYEVLIELIKAMNVMIDNYDTIPEQIADAVKNLDAAQLFSAVLDQLIDTIATDNTKSANAVKMYKKHDLLYATFNETVNLYESLIDFSTGTETELIIGTNIREVNISELFIELRELIDAETQTREQADTTLQQNINTEKSAREQGDTTLQQNINAETSAREQADTALQQKINNETSARSKADTNLQTKIDNGVLKVEKLWQNSNPSEPFAPQIITLDLSKYKFVKILFKLSSYDLGIECTSLLSFTDNIQLTPIFQSFASSGGFGGFMTFREFGYVKNSGINVKDGKKSTSFDSYTTDDHLMIPYIIYGVK